MILATNIKSSIKFTDLEPLFLHECNVPPSVTQAGKSLGHNVNPDVIEVGQLEDMSRHELRM